MRLKFFYLILTCVILISLLLIWMSYMRANLQPLNLPPGAVSSFSDSRSTLKTDTQNIIYRVLDGVLQVDQTVRPDALVRRVWSLYLNYFPENITSQISQFEVSTAESELFIFQIEKLSQASAAPTAQPAGKSKDKYSLRLNLHKIELLLRSSSKPGESSMVDDHAFKARILPILVHETGHQLITQTNQLLGDSGHSLGHSLLEGSVSDSDYMSKFLALEAGCPNYFMKEGCSQPDSWINLFYQEFWKSKWEEYIKIQNSSNSAEFYKSSEQFYLKYKADFVSKDAYLSPEEDFAEVFRVFVMNDVPKQDHTVASQKVAFMHRFPELVELRSSIRDQL